MLNVTFGNTLGTLLKKNVFCTVLVVRILCIFVMLSRPPLRLGYNKTESLLVLKAKVLKMKMSKNELRKMSTRICDLACECQFMADEAKVYSRIVGVYSDSSDSVIDHLRQVLRRADNLLDALHCVSAALDDLLVKDKHLDDVEVADV